MNQVKKSIAVILAAVAVAALPLAVLAGNDKPGVKLEGIVRDAETGKPIQNAYVCVDGCPTAAMTNDSGRFFLNDIPAGSCTVKAFKKGYDDVQQSVYVEKKHRGSLNIDLQKQPEPVKSAKVKSNGST